MPCASSSSRNTVWSGKMFVGSRSKSLNAKSSSSRKHGGPAHGNTCAAFDPSMYCRARAIWFTRLSRARRVAFAGREVVDDRVPDRAGELDEVRVERAERLEQRRIPGPGVVLVEHARRAVVEDDRRVAERPVGRSVIAKIVTSRPSTSTGVPARVAAKAELAEEPQDPGLDALFALPARQLERPHRFALRIVTATAGETSARQENGIAWLQPDPARALLIEQRGSFAVTARLRGCASPASTTASRSRSAGLPHARAIRGQLEHLRRRRQIATAEMRIAESPRGE